MLLPSQGIGVELKPGLSELSDWNCKQLVIIKSVAKPVCRLCIGNGD